MMGGTLGESKRIPQYAGIVLVQRGFVDRCLYPLAFISCIISELHTCHHSTVLYRPRRIGEARTHRYGFDYTVVVQQA